MRSSPYVTDVRFCRFGQDHQATGGWVLAQRRLRFIMVGLAAVMVAPLLAPLSAAAAPIDDKQAEAAQLEQQITENGRKLDALNEQINSAQIALDEANVTIATANEQVATASAKAKQLRDELARRAAVVYRDSGSSSGVSELERRAPMSSTPARSTRRLPRRRRRRSSRISSREGRPQGAQGGRRSRREAAQATEQKIEFTKQDLVAGDTKQRNLRQK